MWATRSPTVRLTLDPAGFPHLLQYQSAEYFLHGSTPALKTPIGSDGTLLTNYDLLILRLSGCITGDAEMGAERPGSVGCA